MRIIILLTITCIATAAIFRHALKWCKPKKVEIIERGEYGAYVKYLSALRLSPNFTQKLYDYGYFVYFANITIGTPPQQFIVAPDTGSATIWIPGSDCMTWEIAYTTGAAQGVFGIDVMKFGGINDQQLTVPNTTFGIAKSISRFFGEVPNDGILGLAFTDLAIGNVTPPLINAIDQSLLDRPLFTVWLQQRRDLVETLEGLVTYGAIDSTNCGEVIAFEPLTTAKYYQFKISAIGIGNYTYQKEEEAISDSGSPYIHGPKAVIDRIAEAAGAVFIARHDIYIIECNVTTPTLFITIGGNKYPIDPLNYILYKIKNICVLSILPNESGGFEAPWSIGIPLIRQFCHIYNIGEKKIGFAPSLVK